MNNVNCPFHGCIGASGALQETDGNQCALVIDKFAPCELEVQGKAVDWRVCQVFVVKLRPNWYNHKSAN